MTAFLFCRSISLKVILIGLFLKVLKRDGDLALRIKRVKGVILRGYQKRIFRDESTFKTRERYLYVYSTAKT